MIRRRLPSRLRFVDFRRSLRSAEWEGRWFACWIAVGGVIAVVVRCARKYAVCSFEALGVVVGALVVDVLVLVVVIAHDVAAAVAVAPGITAGS